MTDARRRIAIPFGIGLSAVALAGGIVPAGAQERITFFFSVTTAAGAPVTNLRAEDLKVLEDGRAGRIIQTTYLTLPVRVSVLVDNGSHAESLLLLYRNGLKALFEALPAGVEASLQTLSPQPRWVVRPTSDRDQLLLGVGRLTADRAAPRMTDGLIEASDRIEQDNRAARAYFPVIVLVSTTGPEGSSPGDRDLERMVRQLHARAATVHVIMLSTGGISPTDVLGAPQVHVAKFLADETGGRYEALASATRIPGLLEEYGRTIAASHRFQRNLYQVVAERPAGAAGPPGKRSVVLSRSDLVFAVSADGRMW